MRDLQVLGFVSMLLAVGMVSSAYGLSFTSGEDANIVIGQSSFTDSSHGTTDSNLWGAQGITFDSSGNLWVADYSNNRILEFTKPFSSGQSAATVIGQSDFTTRASGTTQSGLSEPNGLAFDSSGNLWVADQGNARVLEFTAPFSNGQSAATVIGQSDFKTNTQATTQNGLSYPKSIAFDSSGNLWVSDNLDNRILEFTAPFSNGQSAATVIGQSSFTSNYQATKQNGLFGPNGITFDSSGNLWVADQGNARVLEFTKPFSSGQSAATVIGQSDFRSTMQAVTQAGFQRPQGIAFDSSGNLWVTDTDSSRVLEFSSPFTNGQSAITVIGQSKFTSGAQAISQNGLFFANFVAFDAEGNLWVTDLNNNRILQFPTSTPSSLAISTGTTGSVTLTPGNIITPGNSPQTGSTGMESLSINSQSAIQIPQWVRSNAKFWSNGSIDDSTFDQGLQYMIKQGIIKIPPTHSGPNTGVKIPQWVRSDAKLWSNNEIDDLTFVGAIQYLIQVGIISP